MISQVFAKESTPAIRNPVLPGVWQEGGAKAIGQLISNIMTMAFIVAGLMTTFSLLTGGLQWITSGGDKAGLEAARNKIIHSLVGLVLVVSTWAIITQVLFPFLGLSFPIIKFPTLGG